ERRIFLPHRDVCRHRSLVRMTCVGEKRSPCRNRTIMPDEVIVRRVLSRALKRHAVARVPLRAIDAATQLSPMAPKSETRIAERWLKTLTVATTTSSTKTSMCSAEQERDRQAGLRRTFTMGGIINPS